jgi:hypothetical protein
MMHSWGQKGWVLLIFYLRPNVDKRKRSVPKRKIQNHTSIIGHHGAFGWKSLGRKAKDRKDVVMMLSKIDFVSPVINESLEMLGTEIY